MKTLLISVFFILILLASCSHKISSPDLSVAIHAIGEGECTFNITINGDEKTYETFTRTDFYKEYKYNEVETILITGQSDFGVRIVLDSTNIKFLDRTYPKDFKIEYEFK